MIDDDPIIAKAKQLHDAGATPEQVRQFLLANGYEAGAPVAPPAGHAGKPFVNAPEMMQQHNGTAFVDAEPEPSYATKALGGLASFGRHIADDAQTTARAVTREHGISDLVKGLGQASVDDLVHASRFGPLTSLVSDKLKATPSYAHAREDIHQAEDASGAVGNFNKAAGLAVGAAPLAGPISGAIKGGFEPVATKLSNGLFGRMAKGAIRGMGLEAEAPAAAAEEPIEPPGPPSPRPHVTATQSPMESAAELTRTHPIAADITKTAEAPADASVAKVARQSHRTKASFQDVAQRVSAPTPPSTNPLSIRARILAGIALTPTP